MNEMVPRPGEIPPEVTDDGLKEACRAWLSGGRVDQIARLLGIDNKEFRRATLTQKWLSLQRLVRDEFVQSVEGRLIRINEGLLDRVEDMLEHGVEVIDPLGEKQVRDLNPREVASLIQAVNQTQKAVDKIREGEPHRRTFDQAAKIAEWKKFAEATQIEGTKVN